jgi:soluble lytic murein transglycosylase-like protein
MILGGTFLALALPAAARAASAEDDLAVVKKAVASAAPQATTPAATATPPPSEAKPAPRKGEPQWLRVRIVEKGAKKATVKVNLPLALVRSVGEDWPLDCGHAHAKGRGTTLGEVLRALDSGQELVEIEGDDATVRVWVE